MARFVYDSSKVNTGLDYLKEAKGKLNGIKVDMNSGITTIKSARGYKWLDVDFSKMQSLEDTARTMISDLEKLINEKINMINEYNAYRNEHPIKSKFADFSMGVTSFVRGFHEGAQSLGDSALARLGQFSGMLGNDLLKECCEEQIIERVTKREEWFAKQYESGIWSDVEKYSSFSSKSTKATVFRGAGSAAPYIIAAIGTGGASSAGSISKMTGLLIDSALAADSTLGERTASGLVAGEDFDTAYEEGLKSGAIAGTLTFGLGKAAEKIGSAVVSVKGATSAAGSADDLAETVVKANKSKNIFNKVNKLKNGATETSDDFAKAVENLKNAEKNYQAAIKSGASDAEIIELSDARHLAKKEVKELGGDIKKVLSATDNLDDTERALSKARKGSSKSTELDIKRLETDRANANEIFNDPNNFKKVTTKKAQDVAKSADNLKNSADELRVAERNYEAGLKNNASPEELAGLRSKRLDARLKVQENGGSVEKIAAASKRLDSAEEALANATKKGSKVSQAEIARLETERETARTIFNNVSGMDKQAVKEADKLSKAVENLKNAEKNYQAAIKSEASDAEIIELSDARHLAKKEVKELGGDIKKVLSATDNLDDTERALSKARKGSSKSTELDIKRLETDRANANEIFNDPNNFKKVTTKKAQDVAKSADNLKNSADELRVAERNYEAGLKNNASPEELAGLRSKRLDARLKVQENGGSVEKIAAASKRLDSAEEALANATKKGSKVSQAEIARLETERETARKVFNSTFGATDDFVKQTSKLDVVKNGIKNVKENVANINVGEKVRGAATNIADNAKAVGAAATEKLHTVGTATKNIGVAAMKHPVAASVAVGSTVGLSTAHAANPRVVNTDLAGINVADLSDSVMTASAGDIFKKRGEASGDYTEEDTTTTDDGTDTADNGTGTDNGGGNGNGNGNSRYGSEIVSTDAKNDKTKKIIDQITRKDKLKPGNINVDNNTNNNTNTNTVVPNPNNNVNPNTNNSIENKTVPQQTVQPNNNNVVPSNTEVVAHQVNNNEGTRTVYAGATTVTGGEGGSSSYSGYSGGGSYNNSSVTKATKEIINKSKTSMGNDLGSKVKSVIGQKTIKPIVIDDTTSTTSSRGGSGAGLAVGGVVAAGAAIGLGTKAYLDKKKNSEEYEDDEIEEITQDEGYDTDSAVYEDTNNKEENDNIEMLYDDPYEANEGAAYDDSYDDLAYGEVEDLVTF